MIIAATLREARQRRGLALAAISSATNIPLPVLAAIEQGDMSRVPGGLFSRSYLRAYARQVGLDPERVVAEYVAEHQHESTDTELAALRARCAGRGRRQGVRPTLFLAVLVLLILGAAALRI